MVCLLAWFHFLAGELNVDGSCDVLSVPLGMESNDVDLLLFLGPSEFMFFLDLLLSLLSLLIEMKTKGKHFFK